MKKEKYHVNIRCHNCGHEVMVSIPKGTGVENYRYKNICEYCECPLNN